MSETSPTRSKFFSLRVYRTFWHNLPEIWVFFLTVNLRFWASAEKFPTVFSKMHWRYGGERSYFLLIFHFFFSEPERFLSKFRQKESGCFLKAAKYVRRRLLRYLFQFFSFLSFEQKTSKLWAKLHRRKSHFFIFSVQKTFWYNLPRDFGFFLTVNLKFWGFGRKVVNSVFKNALKIWRKTFLFFVDSSIFFLGTWAFFVEVSAKRIRLFSQSS